MKRKPIQEMRKICEEIRKKPSEMGSLDLSMVPIPVFTPDVKKKLGEFSRLQILELSNCSISQLKDLPYFPELDTINLSVNQITDNEVTYLAKLQTLRVIELAANDIKGLPVFRQFRKLPNLQELQLEINPVSFHEDYRSTAFQVIQALRSLDGYDIQGKYIGQNSENSEDMIISEVDSDDSEENSVQPAKRKRKAKQDSFRFDTEIDSVFESVPPQRKGRK